MSNRWGSIKKRVFIDYSAQFSLDNQEMLNRIRGRSYREAEEELARRKPAQRSPERIRTIFTLKEEERISESTPDVESGEKSVKYPKGIKLELLFDELLESYLEENDPERRTERKSNKPETDNNTRTRHIPQRVKDEVYRRDGGRCSFRGRDGKRCGSRWNLQYDHIVPYGKGGDNSPENLRLLCAEHNQLMAEREYGTEHMACRRGKDP